MGEFNLTKSDMLSDHSKPDHISNLLSDSWDWVKSHKAETAVAVIGVAALAMGGAAGARALGSRLSLAAESKALSAGATELELGAVSALDTGASWAAGSKTSNVAIIELGGTFKPTMSRLASESASVRMVKVGSLANAHHAAAVENALDHGIFGNQTKALVTKLPENFDPRQALRERAAALTESVGKAPAPIPIGWGLESKVLNGGAIELGGTLKPAMARLASEGASVRMVEVGPLAHAHPAAAVENALDHGIFGNRTEALVTKLPENFDPRQALRERAAALAKSLIETPSPIPIKWG